MRVKIRINLGIPGATRPPALRVSRLTPAPDVVAARPAVDVAASRVREALWIACGAPGANRDGLSALTGDIFHESMSGLLRGPYAWSEVLTPATLDDHGVLRRHCEEKLVGPLFARHAARFLESGAEALRLRQAVAETCAWLAGLLRAAHEQRWISYDETQHHWIGADNLLSSEQALERTFDRDDWTAPVRLHGRAGAVLRDPAHGRWCVLEFKTAGGNEVLDVCQVALYQNLLGGSIDEVALMQFSPERAERVFRSADLNAARKGLIAVTGELAGVAAGAPKRPPPAAQYVELGARIGQVLEKLGIAATVSSPVTAPAFVRFTIRPRAHVGVSGILNRAADLGPLLGIPEPLIAEDDGVVALDVARGQDREAVPFERVRECLPAPDGTRGCASIPLGVNLDHEMEFADLTAVDSSHVLVAGAAGSGKSEWLRTAVASLMLTNTPETLRLVLIDPSHATFGDLAASPFLFGLADASTVVQLERLIEEMESRDGAGLPRIVCVIDEFADAMEEDRQRFEYAVTRFCAKGRAAGMHLILATRHAEANTITSLLDASLSARVCLRTDTSQQSMVALQDRGAERLADKGDLLYSQGGRARRLQAPLRARSERAAC